jgi:hypothetical protein
MDRRICRRDPGRLFISELLAKSHRPAAASPFPPLGLCVGHVLKSEAVPAFSKHANEVRLTALNFDSSGKEMAQPHRGRDPPGRRRNSQNRGALLECGSCREPPLAARERPVFVRTLHVFRVCDELREVPGFCQGAGVIITAPLRWNSTCCGLKTADRRNCRNQTVCGRVSS